MRAARALLPLRVCEIRIGVHLTDFDTLLSIDKVLSAPVNYPPNVRASMENCSRYRRPIAPSLVLGRIGWDEMAEDGNGFGVIARRTNCCVKSGCDGYEYLDLSEAEREEREKSVTRSK